MKNQNIDSRAVTLGLVVVAGLLAALVLGRAVGNQNYMHIFAVCGFIFGVLLFFTLGDRYWYLIPFALSTGLPAIPLGGRTIELGELATASCAAFFLTRVALKKDHVLIFRASHIPILLFMAWAAAVFIRYPSGMLLFGAETAGARFYLKLVLAFFAFLIIASREISEKDARNLALMLLAGVAIRTLYGIYSYKFHGGGPAVDAQGLQQEEFYTWHQILSVPAYTIAFLLFARFRPSDIFGFRRPLAFVVYLLSLLMVLLSGKRMALIFTLAAPAFSAIAFNQKKYIWVGSILSAVFLSVMVLGQGNLFNLPLTVQRTISWLPGSWDVELVGAGSTDVFRDTLRRFAIKNIQENPVLGKGFTVDIAETSSAITAALYRGGDDIQVAAFALGHAWHNTWLGYAADFGIPMSIIQAILMITVIGCSFRSIRLLPKHSFKQMIVTYVFIYVCCDVLASWTSGHTALDAFGRWWMYGMVFSIYATVTAKAKSAPPTINSMSAQAHKQAIS
ncbi:MAG: O-antigen ligase family protein [Terrimicrobiaceae bacterium]